MKKKRKEDDIRDLKRLAYMSLIMSGVVLISVISILFVGVNNDSFFGESIRSPLEFEERSKNKIFVEEQDLLKSQLADYVDNMLRLKIQEGGRCCYDSDGNDPTTPGKTVILDTNGNIVSEKIDSCNHKTFTEYYCQDNQIKVNFDKCHAFTGVQGCSTSNSCKI